MNIKDKFELIKGKPSRNRLVQPAMDTLMAKDGMATDFHIQHYGARSYGGVGTIILESTSVSPEGKIEIKDLGLWKDEQIAPIKRIIDIVKLGGAVVGIQLNHAGSKARLHGDVKETYGATEKYSAFIKHDNLHLVTDKDIERIKNDFISAAYRAKETGADFVEVHGAHGYFISQLITPLLNDVSKGSMVERASILIDVVKAIHDDVKIPVGVRLSLTDHEEAGVKPEDFKELIEALNPYISYIHASSGATSNTDRGFTTEKLFRIPMAKVIKQYTQHPVIVVGNFDSRDEVQEALDAGLDGVALGRAILFNPNIAINSILKFDELNEEDYHWNQNRYYSLIKYSKLADKLKAKKNES